MVEHDMAVGRKEVRAWSRQQERKKTRCREALPAVRDARKVGGRKLGKRDHSVQSSHGNQNMDCGLAMKGDAPH